MASRESGPSASASTVRLGRRLSWDEAANLLTRLEGGEDVEVEKEEDDCVGFAGDTRGKFD